MNWSVRRERGRAQVGHVDAVPDVEGGLQGGQLQDRRGADAHPLDPAPGR